MKPRKAFSSLEYIFMFGVIIIGLVSMFVILRQRISGKYRSSADAFGEGRQFEPYGAHKTKETIDGGVAGGPPEVNPDLVACCYNKCTGIAGWDCPHCPAESCPCFPIEPKFSDCSTDCESKPANYGC